MRTRKAIINMFSAFIFQIVSIICGLVVPRLILTNFGSTFNGVINSATQFLNIISILTLGITGATRIALYKTLGSNDILGTSRIVKATKIYMRKVALCIIFYSIILCIVYPFISHNDLTWPQNASIIAIVSISTFAQYFFGIANQTLLQADQVSYIIYILDIFKIIVNTICVVILIKMGGSIYVVKLASSIVFFITPLIMNFFVKRKYGLINNCEPDNTGIKQRGAVALHSVANLIRSNNDLVLLTLFTDAKIISVYTVYYLVIGKIKSLMQVVTTGMEAAFGNMWAKGEISNLKNNFRGFEFMMFAFTAVIFSCVGVLILPFITRYTRGVTDVNYIRVDLAVLITVAEAIFCIRQPYVTLVQATGFYKETQKGALIEVILNVSISLILLFFLEIAGIIIGTLVANAFRIIDYTRFISKNIIKRDYGEIIKRFIWLIISCIIICLLSVSLTSNITFNNDWGGWIFQGSITFIISCTVVLIMSIVFYKNDLTFILKILRRVMKKNKLSEK